MALAAALLSVPCGSARASTFDCDYIVSDRFDYVRSGASFQAYGRSVYLLNGYSSNHSYASIRDGYQSGDLVWADRSINPMPAGVPTYFSDNSYVTSRGGWKQCGPFNGRMTEQVVNRDNDTQDHFAVRACFRPNDGRPSVCGSWYVDRT